MSTRKNRRETERRGRRQWRRKQRLWRLFISERDVDPDCIASVSPTKWYFNLAVGPWFARADQPVLRWATVSGFNSRRRTIISVCNQPATQGQLSLPSLRGRKMSTRKAKAGMVHSVSGWTRGVRAGETVRSLAWTRAIPERLRAVITTRRCTNPRLPLPLPLTMDLHRWEYWNCSLRMWRLQAGCANVQSTQHWDTIIPQPSHQIKDIYTRHLRSSSHLYYYRNPPPGHISPIALFAALHLLSGTLWTVTL